MKLIVANILVVHIVVVSSASSSPKPVNLEKMAEKNSRQEPPRLDNATDVKIGIFINSFHAISEQTMDYSISLYFKQSWSDPRMNYKPTEEDKTPIKFEMAWKKMWVPDTFFRNEKMPGRFHTVTIDNRMLTVDINGDIFYSMKITATLSCPMKLHKFPLDTQTCPMMFESFGYTTNTVVLSWLPKPVLFDKDMQLPQYTYVRHDLKDCSQNFTGGSVTPCLEVDFTLRRDIGYFVIQVYIPSVLIVILSWVSFWINVDASPARVSIGLLTVLTTTTQSSGINTTLPKVSYIKAIDVWMSACLLFVFTALLEYAFINVAVRRKPKVPILVRPTIFPDPHAGPRTEFGLIEGGLILKRNYVEQGQKKALINLKDCPCPCLPMLKRDRADSGQQNNQSGSVGIALAPLAALAPLPKPAKPVDGKSRARSIDKISRLCFPSAFFIFNIVYWIGYTSQSDGE